MYSQSISGIRSNLEAFCQAAARIAQPPTTEESAGIPDEEVLAVGESAGEPMSRSQASRAIDQPRELVNMIVAQRGVEANLGVLKAALSLSGQMVDILA